MSGQTRQERVAAILTLKERVELEAQILEHMAEWLLLRVLAMGPMDWLPLFKRDEDALLARQADRTIAGLNWFASPENPSGKVKLVRTPTLIDEIERRGYVHSHSHVQFQDGKGPVNTIAFRRRNTVVAGQVLQPLNPLTRATLGRQRFNDVNIWGNLVQEPGGRIYRLDTINLAKGMKEPGGDELHLDDNSYIIRAA